MNDLYDMIFKRKSFRRFNNITKLTNAELQDMKHYIDSLKPLVDGIKTEYRIVPRERTTCKRGEYCLLIYSEEKESYLLNVGYMFEQLDLYLASKNIGVCWYGMGKINEPLYPNKNYVIMMAFGKASEDEFRKDYRKCRRKETKDIWVGDLNLQVGEIVKYAPSACNTQPWKVVCKDNTINIYRMTGVKSIMPQNKTAYYNTIDMGIFLYFLELVLSHMGITFHRIMKSENDKKTDAEFVSVAAYRIEI